MHVALRRPKFLMTGELLNRSCGCSSHRQVRAKRVAQHMNALVRQACATSRSPHVIRDHLWRERAAVAVAEHSRPLQVSDLSKSVCQSRGHRDVTKFPSFRCRHVSVPIGSLDAQLSLAKIHITPLQRRDFATPKARFPAQQDDHCAEFAKISTRGDETLVVREVMKVGLIRLRGQVS